MVDVEALVREAYEALKAVVEEEEVFGTQSDSGDSELVGLPEEIDEAHVEPAEQYDGTMGEGMAHDALSTCEKRLNERAVVFGEMMIVGLERDRRFRVQAHVGLARSKKR